MADIECVTLLIATNELSLHNDMNRKDFIQGRSKRMKWKT